MPTAEPNRHGLIGGNREVQEALEHLHRVIEKHRANGEDWAPEIENRMDAAALAHTIMYDRHTEAELARLALKLAVRVEAILGRP